MHIYKRVQSYIVIAVPNTFLCLSTYIPHTSAKWCLLRYSTSLTVTAVVYVYLQPEPFPNIQFLHILYC
jgi:hypothetical protein